MTSEETTKVLAILKAAYPASYRGMTKEEAYGTIQVWASQFASDPVEVIIIAVQKLIATSVFPPTISEVKSKLSGMYWEAWAEVRQYVTGNRPFDEKRYFEMKAIESACIKYTTIAKEPTLQELLGESKNYLTAGKDDHYVI